MHLTITGPDVAMDPMLEKHSGEMLILVLAFLLMATLLIVVPQLLRYGQRANEMRHEENLKALAQGQKLPPFDMRSRVAGRAASLVPMVAVISAATVTCFLVAYRSEVLFSVAVTTWTVAGLVSMAAVTGGVTLLARLAQIESGFPDETDDDETGRS
jgi:hypothetical protein